MRWYMGRLKSAKSRSCMIPCGHILSRSPQVSQQRDLPVTHLARQLVGVLHNPLMHWKCARGIVWCLKERSLVPYYGVCLRALARRSAMAPGFSLKPFYYMTRPLPYKQGGGRVHEEDVDRRMLYSGLQTNLLFCMCILSLATCASKALATNAHARI